MSSVSASQNESTWDHYQKFIKMCSTTGESPPSGSASIETSSTSLQRTAYKRDVIAAIVKMVRVPSHYKEKSSENIQRETERSFAVIGNQREEPRCPAIIGGTRQIEIEEIDGKNWFKIKCVIVYHKKTFFKDYKSSERTGLLGKKCVIYNNPNGITVDDFLEDQLSPSVAPHHILDRVKCPMIMYDYRGTGINNQLKSFKANKHTVTLDGYAVLNYAMRKFKNVEVWGSSLGGGVATVACETYLEKNPSHADRLSLYNHDSFRTIGKVLPRYLSFIVTISGRNLNAEIAMRKLAQRGLKKIVILCHRNDPVIPAKARIADIFNYPNENITLIESSGYGHANLSMDMVEQLALMDKSDRFNHLVTSYQAIKTKYGGFESAMEKATGLDVKLVNTWLDHVKSFWKAEKPTESTLILKLASDLADSIAPYNNGWKEALFQKIIYLCYKIKAKPQEMNQVSLKLPNRLTLSAIGVIESIKLIEEVLLDSETNKERIQIQVNKFSESLAMYLIIALEQHKKYDDEVWKMIKGIHPRQLAAIFPLQIVELLGS